METRTFKFKDRGIRVAFGARIWTVHADVVDTIGRSKPRVSEKTRVNVETRGGVQGMVAIHEGALERIAGRVNTDREALAGEFLAWFRAVVVPAGREAGVPPEVGGLTPSKGEHDDRGRHGSAAASVPLAQDVPVVQAFAFDGAEVRVVMRDGEPWWVATDVCAALCIANTSQAVARLDDDERMTVDPTLSPGGTEILRPPLCSARGAGNPICVVNEPGLYELVMSSRKPEAKRFKRWVKRDVLPSIRKTGSYSVTPVNPGALLDDPESMLTLALEECKRRKAAEAEVVQLQAVVVEKDQIIDLLAADLDALEKAGDAVDIDIAAGLISRDPAIGRIGPRQLHKWLVLHKWTYKRGKRQRIHVSVDAMGRGLMDIRYSEPWVDGSGNEHRSATPLMTPHGIRQAMALLRVERGSSPEPQAPPAPPRPRPTNGTALALPPAKTNGTQQEIWNEVK